jgi:DNA-binding MarR family transcriptional regulator
MEKRDVFEQARLIFETGIIIRDRVIRAHTAHATEGEECCELSISQMHAVLATREHGQVTVSELAEIGGVSPPSASAMVDRLVEKGVLLREHSQEDRRKVIVRVSPEAEKTIEKAEQRILQVFVDLVEKIGPETTQKWVEVLERVREVLLEEGSEIHRSIPLKG